MIGFAALFMRLWALQVLSGSQYAAQAQANQVRTVRVEAPRGPIVDAKGNILVTNRPVTSVELSPAGMPKTYAARAAEVRAIAHVAGVSVRRVTKLIVERKRRGDMLDPIVVRTEATGPMLTYLEERAAAFPGLTLARSYIRRYPHGSVAAQLLGYDGQISQQQLKTLAGNGYEPGDVIGQTGIESALDMYLRGVPGLARVRVDSLGRPRSRRLLTAAPQPGQTVRLTIDTQLQIAAQNALDDGIQRAINSGQWAADGGAIVALNPKDGSILALASSPSYDPSVYSGRVTTARAGRAGPDAEDGARPELSGAQPSARRHVSAGLGLQAAHRDRGAPGAPDQAVRLLSVHGHVHGSRGHCAPRLPQLGPLRQPGDGSADGDRPVVRHVLLPRRQQVLPAAEGPRPADPAVGAPLRVRADERLRPHPAGARARADDRLAAPHVHEATIRRTGRSTGCGSPATRSSSRSARAT